MYVYLNMCMYMHIHIGMCIYIYTHRYTIVHRYVHTHVYVSIYLFIFKTCTDMYIGLSPCLAHFSGILIRLAIVLPLTITNYNDYTY